MNEYFEGQWLVRLDYTALHKRVIAIEVYEAKEGGTINLDGTLAGERATIDDSYSISVHETKSEAYEVAANMTKHYGSSFPNRKAKLNAKAVYDNFMKLRREAKDNEENEEIIF